MGKGKKKREREAPPAATPAELIEERVAREQAWAFDLYLARFGFHQMCVLSGRPVEDGGLGYYLTESALRGLVRGAREARGDVDLTVDERRERQLAEVDVRIRLARADLEAAREMGDAKGVESADRRLHAAQELEAKIAGTFAAQRIEADVTNHDGVQRELEEMLARNGRPPATVQP